MRVCRAEHGLGRPDQLVDPNRRQWIGFYPICEWGRFQIWWNPRPSGRVSGCTIWRPMNPTQPNPIYIEKSKKKHYPTLLTLRTAVPSSLSLHFFLSLLNPSRHCPCHSARPRCLSLSPPSQSAPLPSEVADVAPCRFLLCLCRLLAVSWSFTC